MHKSVFFCVGAVLFALSSTAQASTFRFDTDPFAGTTALATPGRQITTVPEPATLSLFAVGGVIGAAVLARRRQHARR